MKDLQAELNKLYKLAQRNDLDLATWFKLKNTIKMKETQIREANQVFNDLCDKFEAHLDKERKAA